MTRADAEREARRVLARYTRTPPELAPRPAQGDERLRPPEELEKDRARVAHRTQKATEALETWPEYAELLIGACSSRSHQLASELARSLAALQEMEDARPPIPS